MEDAMSKIMDKISKIRKNKGFSYENMASDLGLSSSAYRKIEMGETKLTVDRLLQLADLLDFSIEEILESGDQKKFNQENHNNETVNAYQGNIYSEVSALTQKLLSTYEQQIEELKKENLLLKSKL